jgi:hypothetical protein
MLFHRWSRLNEVPSICQNQNEIQTVVHLVRHYYKHKDFCVITPYDAQRAGLEKQLKAEGLPWERVFNVDSFQGESCLIICSMAVFTVQIICIRERSRICYYLCCTHHGTRFPDVTEQGKRHAHTL